MRNVWHFIRIEKSTICTSCWADCLGSSHLGVNVCHKSVHIVVVFVAFPSAQSFDAARIIPSLRPHMFAMFKQKPWNKTTKISVYYSVTHPTTKTKRVKKKHNNDIHPHPVEWSQWLKKPRAFAWHIHTRCFHCFHIIFARNLVQFNCRSHRKWFMGTAFMAESDCFYKYPTSCRWLFATCSVPLLLTVVALSSYRIKKYNWKITFCRCQL